MLHVDKKYIMKISPQLRNFKVVSDNAWRFSCVYCGDSLKDPKKTRGNIYFKNYKLLYKCFNCGISKSIQEFIQDMDSMMFQEYQLDNYKAGADDTINLEIFGGK